jgi:hypothetical protein
MPSSRGGTPQDHGWQPRPAVSVDRVCAGHLALHMASTVRGYGASATSPSDSESCPKSLGSFKRLSERTGGAARWQGARPRTHSHRGKDPWLTHLKLAAAVAPAPAAPLPPGRPSRPTHTHRAQPSHHHVLPPRLGTLAPAAHLSHHDAHSLDTQQGALWHPRCPTRGAATFSGIRGRRGNSEPSLARAIRNRHTHSDL